MQKPCIDYRKYAIVVNRQPKNQSRMREPESRNSKDGGRERIRTSGRITPTPDFESGAFNHSATLPLESTRLLICANHTPQQAELDSVNPSGLNPNFSRIELNPFRSYSITVFGSAFCLAQSPLTAPFFYM